MQYACLLSAKLWFQRTIPILLDSKFIAEYEVHAAYYEHQVYPESGSDNGSTLPFMGGCR
jgi:hypothetical protein